MCGTTLWYTIYKRIILLKKFETSDKISFQKVLPNIKSYVKLKT